MMKKVLNCYYRHFLGYELILSVLATATIISLLKIFKLECDFFKSLLRSQQSLYGTLVAVFGALLGFVITGLSILLTTNDDSEGMKALKGSRRYNDIFKIFISTSRYLAIATFVSLFGLISDNSTVSLLNRIIAYIVIWCIMIAVFRVSRCIWVLEKIILIMHPKKKSG